MSCSAIKDMKVAIIGVGGMGNTHLKNYVTLGAQIVAVVDSNFEKAQAVAKEFNCKAYSNYQELLDNEELNAVSVCTPPVFHKDAVIACLNKKINVLCEKPMAATAVEAKAMNDAAAANGVMLMLAYCHRFQWQVEIVKQWINEGKFGKIVLYENRFGGMAAMENRWFSKKEISGGGMVLDTLTHSMDLYRFLVGDAKSVKASIHTNNPKLNVDDTAVLLLQSNDGVIGTLEGTWYAPVTENQITVSGSKGTAYISYNKDNLTYCFEGMKDFEVMTAPAGDLNRFNKEIKAFLEGIIEGKAKMATGIDGVKAMEIYEAAMNSATN